MKSDAALRTWMPYLVGVTALLFSVLAWLHVRWTAQSNDDLRAEAAAKTAIDTITDRINAQIGVLRATAGLFASANEVTREGFRKYVERLNLPEHYPGTMGIGFSMRVDPSARDDLVQRMRRDVPDFEIWPAEDHEEWHSIIYLEPLNQRNQLALGYNMMSESRRREAMILARDSGDAFASGKVQLVQEGADGVKQAGFIIYVPVYRDGTVPASVEARREQLFGFVYSPFRADDLLRSIFAGQKDPVVDMRVYDGRAPSAPELMYDSRTAREGADDGEGEGDSWTARPNFDDQAAIAGRPWNFVFTIRPAFEATSQRYLATYILLAGIVISLLLFAVSLSQRRATMDAERTAAQLRLSQASLRESEQRFRATFNQAATGMAQIGVDGRFLSVNQRLCDITGRSDDELLGMTFLDITHPGDHPAEQEYMRLMVDGMLDVYSMEKRYLRGDGRMVWVNLSRSAVRDADGRLRYCIGVVEDITERKRAEEELQRHRDHLEYLVAERTAELETSHQRLRRSERLAALGTLSTGLGHDMGNLLLPIRLRLATMQSKGLPPEFAEDLEAIRKSSEYLQQLANGLRLLALDPEDDRASEQATDLATWWNDARALLRNALPRGVQLESEIPSPAPGVRVARHLLTQAVFNLVQNAGDALRSANMLEGGLVRVWVQVHPGSNMLTVGVSDNGPGMSAEVRSRCLEPFFTTKTRGISTGLGLALVHGIAQRSGGAIDVQSEPGEGSTFRLTLPAIEREIVAEPEPAGPRIPAVVSLHDARRRAYLVSVLNGLGFEVHAGEQPPEGESGLWVVDADSMMSTSQMAVDTSAGVSENGNASGGNNAQAVAGAVDAADSETAGASVAVNGCGVPAALQRAWRFVQGGARRRAIVFADDTADDRGGHTLAVEGSATAAAATSSWPAGAAGIIVLSTTARPTAIWQAARDIARDLNLQPA
jgi:PAS domain S-box-containing protein